MEAGIDRQAMNDINTHFQALSALVPMRAIHTEADYEKAIAILNQLLDAGAADESSPLADLTNVLGSLVADYEDAQNPVQKVPPLATLRFLMQQHQLTQANLPEIGTQGVVSEILSGKRELNVRQIKKLAERFQVPAAVFI